MKTEIHPIEVADFTHIETNLQVFWGDRHSEVRALHHPMFVYEFGDTGFVIREDNIPVAYLLGFVVTEKKLGYIHFIGVRESTRKKGYAKALYRHFEEMALKKGCTHLKAITPIKNQGSIHFHRALGFTLLGEPNADGIPVVKNYRAPGEDRVVFSKVL
jgi:ribosomal protein S18 acetylase RimI-like enzyme